MRKTVLMEEIPNLSGDDYVIKSDLELLRKDMQHEFQLVRRDLEIGLKDVQIQIAKGNQKLIFQMAGFFALINGLLFAGVKWV